MTTRHLATIYFCTAVVWLLAAGITEAVALAGHSLPTVMMPGENLSSLLWVILATLAIAAVCWPLVLKHARNHLWVSGGP